MSKHILTSEKKCVSFFLCLSEGSDTSLVSFQNMEYIVGVRILRCMCVCDILYVKYISYSSHIFLYMCFIVQLLLVLRMRVVICVCFAEVGHLCILFYGLIYFCVCVCFSNFNTSVFKAHTHRMHHVIYDIILNFFKNHL